MLNLSLIKRSKNNQYLGLSGLLLFEVPDNDNAVQAMLPEWVKFKMSDSCAYTGQGLRLVLTNIRGNVLIMIRNAKSENGVRRAQLICFVNESSNVDKILLDDLRDLASNRWPSGTLFIKSSILKKHPSQFKSTLLQSGWVLLENGSTMAIHLKKG